MSDTPQTIQEIIDRSSHRQVEDGAGKWHRGVLVKITDLRTIEAKLAVAENNAEIWRKSGERSAREWNSLLTTKNQRIEELEAIAAAKD